MTAGIVRFEARAEVERRREAETLAALLVEFAGDGVEPRLRSTLLRAYSALRRVAHPDSREGLWPGGFVMISRDQTALVWDWIRRLPSKDRPQQVRHAFDLVLLSVDHDTGEVRLSRAEMAEAMGCEPRNVSTVMGTLEKAGIIRRERRRLEGVQGPGEVVYFVNPHVGWNGSLEARKAEAAKVSPPLLRLMQGGTSDG